MAETFNPYHRWLGLAEDRATPNYYELFGLDRGERDAERIAQAADRATAKVRSSRPGPQAALWARLLDEIQQAKACLVDAQRREMYDESLTAAEEPESPAPALSSEANAPRESRRITYSASYPPGMGPRGSTAPADQKNVEQKPSRDAAESAPAASPFSSKLYPPGSGSLSVAPAVPQKASTVVVSSVATGVAATVNPASGSPADYAVALPPAGGSTWPAATGVPNHAMESAPTGYMPSAIPSAIPLGGGMPVYGANPYPQAIPVGGPAQPQYGVDPYAAAPAAPYAQYPSGMMPPLGSPPGAYGNAYGNVPAQYCYPAQPQGYSNQPQAYVTQPQGYAAPPPPPTGATYDPMAPVAYPPPAGFAAEVFPPASKANYATSYVASTPVGNPMSAVPVGTAIAAAGAPTGAAVPIGSLAGSAAHAVGGPVDSLPHGAPVRSSASTVTAAAARRKQESQSNLTLFAVAGGLVIVAGALAIIAFNSGGAGDSAGPTVAQNQDPLSPEKTAAKPAAEKTVAPPPSRTEKPPRSVAKTPESPQMRTTSPPENSAPPMTPSVTAAPVTPMPVTPPPMPATTPAITPPVTTPTTPTPTPPVTPPPPTPPVVEKPTKEQLSALGKVLTNAKAALSEQNFEEANRSLAAAEKLAKLSEHQAKIGRLKLVANYVRQFRTAIEDATKNLEAASSFKVGSSTQVGVVEVFPDKITIRSAGINKTYPFQDLPLGLAVALADMKLDTGDPVSKLVKGAYLAVDKRSDSEDLEKAKQWWEEARAGGVDIGDLPLFLTDRYDFEKEAVDSKAAE